MNNNRRYNRKRMGQKLDHQSTQSFLALQFTDSLDDLYTSEYVESNPSVIISGTDFIFDYSSKTNKDKYQDVVTLLKLKKSGITFDISNAEYYNPENNISANFSGTYTLSKFLGNDKIVLSNVSGATWDSKQKLYKDNYFKSNMLMGLTLPAGATGHYKVTNQLGYTSSESFSKMGAVVGDFLKIVAVTGGVKEDKLYEILEFDIDYQGKEILTVDREIPEVDLTGETVSITLFKPDQNSMEKTLDGAMCFYAKETLFNPTTYQYIEKGSLVECRNGREQQGRIESVESGFDFIFVDAIENLSEKKFNASECETCPSLFGENPQVEYLQSQRSDQRERLDESLAAFDTLISSNTDLASALDTANRKINAASNFQYSSVQEYKNITEELSRKQAEISLGRTVTLDAPIHEEFKVTIQNEKLLINGNRTSIINLERGKTYKFLLSITNNLNLSDGPYAVYGTDSNRGNPTGFYYPVFSSPPQGISIDETITDRTKYHTHNIDEIPGITFYMPNTSKNHGKSSKGGYPQFLVSRNLNGDLIGDIVPVGHRLSFSKTPDGSNAGGSLIYTGVQRVNLTNSNYVLLTVPKNLNEFYYFLEGLPGSGGKINVLDQGT